MEDLGSGSLHRPARPRVPARAHGVRGRGSRRGRGLVLRRQAPRRPAGRDRGGPRRPDRAARPEPAQPRAPHRQADDRRARGHALRLRGGRPRSRRSPRSACSPSRWRRSARGRAGCCAGCPRRRARALGAALVEARSQVGGGALPTVELPTAAVALGTAARPAHGLDEALRAGCPPCSAACWTTGSSSTAAPCGPTTCRRSPVSWRRSHDDPLERRAGRLAGLRPLVTR